MVKLTQELIEQAWQMTNPVKDRQLDLRGYKIPAIENLGATLDQFDCLDFTDNEIRKVDNFPLLKRLRCLLLSNNHISRISDHLEVNLPKLESIVLINNRISELDSLSTVSTLEDLSLLFNPVTKKKYYRSYIIYKLPQVKRLDFQKIKMKERNAAQELFENKKGQDLLKELGKKSKPIVSVTSEPTSNKNLEINNVVNGSQSMNKPLSQPPSVEKSNDKEDSSIPAMDLETIKSAITSAKTLEEVEHLKKMLQTRALAPSSSERAEEEMEN